MRGCLTDEEVIYRATGQNKLWVAGEEHLGHCTMCIDRVAAAKKERIEKETAEVSDTVRPNKMGHTDQLYLKRLTTP